MRSDALTNEIRTSLGNEAAERVSRGLEHLQHEGDQNASSVAINGLSALVLALRAVPPSVYEDNEGSENAIPDVAESAQASESGTVPHLATESAEGETSAEVAAAGSQADWVSNEGPQEVSIDPVATRRFLKNINNLAGYQVIDVETEATQEMIIALMDLYFRGTNKTKIAPLQIDRALLSSQGNNYSEIAKELGGTSGAAQQAVAKLKSILARELTHLDQPQSETTGGMPPQGLGLAPLATPTPEDQLTGHDGGAAASLNEAPVDKSGSGPAQLPRVGGEPVELATETTSAESEAEPVEGIYQLASKLMGAEKAGLLRDYLIDPDARMGSKQYEGLRASLTHLMVAHARFQDRIDPSEIQPVCWEVLNRLLAYRVDRGRLPQTMEVVEQIIKQKLEKNGLTAREAAESMILYLLQRESAQSNKKQPSSAVIEPQQPAPAAPVSHTSSASEKKIEHEIDPRIARLVEKGLLNPREAQHVTEHLVRQTTATEEDAQRALMRMSILVQNALEHSGARNGTRRVVSRESAMLLKQLFGNMFGKECMTLSQAERVWQGPAFKVMLKGKGKDFDELTGLAFHELSEVLRSQAVA